MTTTPAVPPMSITLTGEYEGGAYPTEVELRYTARTDGTTITLTLRDERDEPLHTTTLTLTEAADVLARIKTPDDAPAATLPELGRQLTYTIYAHPISADLTNHLEQLGDWLAYATGINTWNSTYDGPTWEY